MPRTVLHRAARPGATDPRATDRRATDRRATDRRATDPRATDPREDDRRTARVRVRRGAALRAGTIAAAGLSAALAAVLPADPAAQTDAPPPTGHARHAPAFVGPVATVALRLPAHRAGPAHHAAPAAPAAKARPAAPAAPARPAAPRRPAAPARSGSGSASAVRASALRAALSKLGAPYVWGASGPSAFDCSGLVQWAFRQEGVALPRVAAAQAGVGTPVSRADLQPGDLVFFYAPISHVGIYVGNGQIVHASTAGSPVKITSIAWMPFAAARRI